MKFGQNLHRYQVVEWTPFYIDYKGLKKLYRLATKVAVERGEDADFTGLPTTMSRLSDLTVAQSSQLFWSRTCSRLNPSTKPDMRLSSKE